MIYDDYDIIYNALLHYREMERFTDFRTKHPLMLELMKAYPDNKKLKYDTGFDYINEQSKKHFYDLGVVRQRVSRKVLMKNLLERQEQVFYDLIEVYGMPMDIRFIDVLAHAILYPQPRLKDTKRKPVENALFFMGCLSGFILINYFGGRFVQCEKGELVVALERIPVSVQIFRKVYGVSHLRFYDWYYELFMILWAVRKSGHFSKASLLNSKLDCILIREQH